MYYVHSIDFFIFAAFLSFALLNHSNKYAGIIYTYLPTYTEENKTNSHTF